MESPVLTLDLGNSRLKASLFDGGDLSERFECSTGESHLEARLASWIDSLPGAPSVAALSSVAHPELERTLRQSLSSISGMDLLVHPEPGLEMRVREVETVGLDRLYAARGAVELLGRSALIVDAGTAMTVDAVESLEGGGGAFLGGAIAPGPRLQIEALGGGGARLMDVDLEPGVPALGKDTREALRAGVVVGFEGACLHLVERVSKEAGLEGACVVLTGGARSFLEPVLRAASVELVVEPALVHMGLLAAAEDARG